jgi:hypothetical protein
MDHGHDHSHIDDDDERCSCCGDDDSLGHNHHPHDHAHTHESDDDCCGEENCCGHSHGPAHSHDHAHGHGHENSCSDDDCCGDADCCGDSHQHMYHDHDHVHGPPKNDFATPEQTSLKPTSADTFTPANYPDFTAKHTFRMAPGDQANRINSFSSAGSFSDHTHMHLVDGQPAVCSACDPNSTIPHALQTTRLRIANLCCAGEERIIHNVLDGKAL